MFTYLLTYYLDVCTELQKYKRHTYIMEYYWKNPLHFEIDPTQSGRLAAILDFCYNIVIKNSNPKEQPIGRFK